MPRFNDVTIEKLFGKEDAENENKQRLKEYFYRNKAYQKLREPLPIRIVVGHKGVGKSAILKMSALEDEEGGYLNLWIRPNDLVKYTDYENPDINKMIEIWKRAITDLVFNKTIERLGIADSEANNSMLLHSLVGVINAIRELVRKKLGDVADATAKVIAANFLKDETIRVYIDDLDRGWKGRPQDIANISALLNAIRDLCGEDNRLQFRIGLRTDVYFIVRTSDESTDKIESALIWLAWTNHEILVVTAKRISSYFRVEVSDSDLSGFDQNQITSKYLSRVMEPRFHGRGKWENTSTHKILTSLVRRRPRDMVKLLHGAARSAEEHGHDLIKTSDFQETFESYSNERLQDIINEFRTELPLVEALVQGMRPTTKEKTTLESFLFTNDRLLNKLKNIMQNQNFVFANGTPATAKSLAEFLYKIDFIIARKDEEGGETIRKYFDQNRILQSQFADFGFKWEVHPAYRWALEPSSVEGIFKNLDPEA